MGIFKSENLLSLAVAILGVITLFASSSVLFGYSDILGKEGNYPSFVLWGNLITGLLYLLVAIGFKYSKKWTLQLLLGILIILIVNLIVFIFFLINGENYETETLKALSFRIAITGTLAFFAFKKDLIKNKK
ncbi:hypothetical protein ACKGJN_10165 [Gillisia sp. Q332]|uniref:hypothetical protein n=1 Tax=Gillisia xinjiangensis TaxID=3384765 RepID=UPI003918BEF0